MKGLETMQLSKNKITTGPMFINIILFVVPIILSNVLQITFNVADIAVVGQFCGSNAVASIGATNTLTHLFLNLFIGLATGATIVVSFSLGAEQYENASEHAHNAIAIALFSGIIVGIAANIAARPMLSALGTPEGEILDGAVKYFRIYFFGAPALLLYNFGAAILKANGNSKSPFIYLTTGGIINVMLNLVFVLVLKMDVAGVAIATVISNVVASALVLIKLIKDDGTCQIKIKKIRFYPKSLLAIFKFGLPAGIQSCMFTVPNLMIQSSINSFGAVAIAGNAAATNVSGYCDMIITGFVEATLTFVSQNFGAKKYKRIRNACGICLISMAIIDVLLGIVLYMMSKPVLSIFIPGDVEAIKYGTIRLLYVTIPCFIGGMMNILTATLRGIGKPLFPMITCIFGVCIVRIIWLMTVFPVYPTIECVYLTYPVTWSITVAILAIYVIISFGKLKKDNKALQND